MRASNSAIQCFKTCRRKYWLRYVEGLEYNKPVEALERGKSYHAKLEELYNEGYFTPDENLKTNAMAMAYQKYIYPKFPVQAVEEWFEKDVVGGHKIIGRIDGKTPDGQVVEHKSVSGSIGEDYEYRLSFDEQILTYMLAKGTNEIYYTACQLPTIRQKKGESEEEFQQRLVEWFDTDTDKKIRVIKVTRSLEELEEFGAYLPHMLDEMESCDFFYRNPGSCCKYGRMCEYAPVCLNYDPTAHYVDFDRRERETRK